MVNVDRVRPAESLPADFILSDFTDAGAAYDVLAQTKPDVVCHLAANPAPGGDARQIVFANNVLSTYHIMQAAGDWGVRRFIYASSEMATGWLTTDELPARFPFDETDRVPSPNAYALSKYMGEIIADSLSRRYPQMPVVSLRINNVITPDTYTWLEDRRNGFPSNGSGNFWSYIDVRDVASAFRLAAEGSTTGHEVFLIAARDHCLDMSFADAVRVRFGDDAASRIAADHPPHASAFDCGKIYRTLGWQAAHSWRDQPI